MYNRRIDGEGAGRGLVRIFQAAGAVSGWYVSFMFSVMGFATWQSGNHLEKLAYMIVIFFTALQLWVNHQNRDDPNYGLAISGIVSYGYGIITNVMGILSLTGTSLPVAWETGAYWQIALALCLGIPLEIAPESLLMKAIFPNSRNMVSDAAVGLGQLFKDLFGGGGSQSSYRPSVDDLTTHPVTRRPAPPPAKRSTSPLNPRRNPGLSSLNSQPFQKDDEAGDPNDQFHMLG